jgi:hypothetical protein
MKPWSCSPLHVTLHSISHESNQQFFHIYRLDILCNGNQPDALFILSYFVIQPLHVSGMFVAHHQEVFTVYVQQLVRVVLLS